MKITILLPITVTPAIDSLARLKADVSNEEAFNVVKKSVKIGYDPTEGLVDMEVIAASPDASVEFSNAPLKVLRMPRSPTMKHWIAWSLCSKSYR
ncbi:hypothetical protein OAM99_00430 [Planktomarina sp.]|nr:hypothetical protein [Planktomarina sp.]